MPDAPMVLPPAINSAAAYRRATGRPSRPCLTELGKDAWKLVRIPPGMPTYFCDGVRGVTVLNGVARIEFHRLQTVERGGGRQAEMVPEMIVALPAQGLLRALAVLERVRDELIKEGLLKPGETAPVPPAKSPNF